MNNFNVEHFCLPMTESENEAWLERMQVIIKKFQEDIKVDPIAEMLERAYLSLVYVNNEKVTYKKLIYNALVIAGYNKIKIYNFCKTVDYRMPLGSNMHDAAYDKIKYFVERW